MNRRHLFALAAVAFSALLSVFSGGCTRHDPADSSIPWGRPAAWEDRVPGMDF